MTSGSNDIAEGDKFFNIVFAFQVLMIFFFAIFVKYGGDCNTAKTATPTLEEAAANTNLYGTFQDVHVMMFVGFGFLMTFLKKYGLSSLSFNFLVTVLAIQWNVLTSGTHGFWHFVYTGVWHKIELTMPLLIESDFAAAVCLISMGAVLGKTNALQLAVMVIFEMVFFNMNLSLCLDWLQITDQGGSIVVHTFGAFFGMACSWILSPKRAIDHKDNSSTRTSDTFAMIGTLFLWMFWPSFNGALATGQTQTLVVMNTTFALCGSAVATFLFSFKLRSMGKFDMVDIQNATLAGGVAVGAISNLLIKPAGALGIGFVAGCFCVIGYVKIQPAMEAKFGLHDTCGVQNLHGYSGVMSGIASAIALAMATKKDYGDSYDVVFANHADPSTAAVYQLFALGLTLSVAIVSGLTVGKILTFLDSKSELFDDDTSFEESLHHVPNKVEDIQLKSVMPPQNNLKQRSGYSLPDVQGNYY